MGRIRQQDGTIKVTDTHIWPTAYTQPKPRGVPWYDVRRRALAVKRSPRLSYGWGRCLGQDLNTHKLVHLRSHSATAIAVCDVLHSPEWGEGVPTITRWGSGLYYIEAGMDDCEDPELISEAISLRTIRELIAGHVLVVVEDDEAGNPLTLDVLEWRPWR